MEPRRTLTPDEKYTAHSFSNRRLDPGAENSNANQEYPNEFNSSAEHNAQSQQNSRQPQYRGSYTMIPPVESRRAQMQRMAQQEEQDLQRWKEEHRPGPINLPPTQIGGALTMTEARQKLILQSGNYKLQKKLKQEAMERQRREQEEEQNQLKKAMQRDKAMKLTEKRRQEDQQRKLQFEPDRLEKTEQLSQRIKEKSSSAPTATSITPPASSWTRGREYREAQRQQESAAFREMKEAQRQKSELQEAKQLKMEEKRQREIVSDHRRVNSAFLDRLQGVTNHAREAERPLPTPEDSDAQHPLGPESAPGAPLSVEPSGPTVTPGLAESAEEDDCDTDWVVMKLVNQFPFYERELLADIVDQCGGDYEQAYELLK
ncbi:hypothetical protein GJAV_G00212190 [Gymnothorax javanicus]|nr:hypothetical protein GJAV_G00212190 [Gymnothorax javanicus]